MKIQFFVPVLICWLLVNNAFAGDVLIQNLNDISATGIPGSSRNLLMTEKICVGILPEGNYNLMARGDGPGGAFVLANAAAVMNYRVYFRDRSEGLHELFASVPLTGIPGRRLRPNNQDCRGNSAQVRLEIDHEEINQAVAGIYRGTLILTVAAE